MSNAWFAVFMSLSAFNAAGITPINDSLVGLSAKYGTLVVISFTMVRKADLIVCTRVYVCVFVCLFVCVYVCVSRNICMLLAMLFQVVH